MALCESQLHPGLPPVGDSPAQQSGDIKPNIIPPEMVPSGLMVDYRSPRSHFLPQEIETSARRQLPSHADTGSSTSINTLDSTASGGSPVKRKRGRPRVDKNSPEYQAQAAARKQAKEMAVVLSSSGSEKRKRGRPRVDKTSPEYIARKSAKELEAIERKAQRQFKRRPTGDSQASSSTGEVRSKRKYTKRGAPGGGGGEPKKRGRKKKMVDGQAAQMVPGRPKKRGRRRKSEIAAIEAAQRARSNEGVQIVNSEPIPVDSDDEPDLGSPGGNSDSLNLDENLRALRHIHEKYANMSREEDYALRTHQLAAIDLVDDEPEPSGDSAERKSAAPRVERLSSSSSSDSSASGSSSSGSSGSSSSSSSSSSSEDEADAAENGKDLVAHERLSHSRTPSPSLPPAPAWLPPEREPVYSNSESGSEAEPPAPAAADGAVSLSESDNESPDKSFPCTQCGKWFSTNVTLKIHKRKHLRRTANNGATSRWRRRAAADAYECDCCSESFSCREHLIDHKAEKHRGSMTVRCEVCRRCFEQDRELAAHLRTHTDDERAGRCSECGAQFERWEQLRRHRACVHPPPTPAPRTKHSHVCNQCGKAFGHAHSLTRHLANHSKAIYRCVVCKVSFAHANLLAQHLNSHLANYKKLKQ